MARSAKKFKPHPKSVQPDEDNDDTWPLGMLPGGTELNLVDEELNSVNPTEENE